MANNFKSNNLIKACCDHYYCKLCYEKINQCSLCRTNFIKKNTNTKTIGVNTIGVNTIRPPMPQTVVSPWGYSSIDIN